MPGVSKLSLPPIEWDKETIGERVARIRKERGYTQVELAGKIGILQTLVTDYENNRLRLSAEMAVRFALALDVWLDELLHPRLAPVTWMSSRLRMLPCFLRYVRRMPPVS